MHNFNIILNCPHILISTTKNIVDKLPFELPNDLRRTVLRN